MLVINLIKIKEEIKINSRRGEAHIILAVFSNHVDEIISGLDTQWVDQAKHWLIQILWVSVLGTIDMEKFIIILEEKKLI